MKRLLLLFLLLFTLSFGAVIPVDADVANHAFIGAALTKVVDATVHNDEATFWIMTTLFLAKEIADNNGTGFSIDDLVYDYAGFFLIKGELKF